MLGKGRAEALDNGAIEALAIDFGCHPATLEAISQVESRGFGWFPDGRIKILFEKHWFYKHLKGNKRRLAVSQGLARRKWISPKRGGYKEQKSADQRYYILARAMEIDEEAALRSVSVGTYQIMGFNAELCGFSSAKEMWAAFQDSEKHQLRAFANFLRKRGLVTAVQRSDFRKIEKVYNGGGLNGAYARKMERAEDRLKSGKWADWSASVEEVVSHPLDNPPIPNPKPLAPSRTIKGGGIAAGGGIAVAVEPVLQTIEVIKGQKEALSSGEMVTLAIACLIIGGALLTLYARWDDAGRPLPGRA